MEKRIVECVPNFSEGRDKAVIRQITSAIESSGGVKLLDVDPGEATNRTVVTFVGSPEAVVEAAFAGVKKAAEVIDMRRHKGAHPRMGATDVLPLIPISGITLEECAALARKLAERIAAELRIPTYCYEAAARTPERRNLAVCRAGEYEALPDKLAHGDTAPDFGARPFDEGVARTGATVVGARDFLIAVNFNLNTTSTRRANAIAFDVREKGRPVREGNPITGKVVKDADGNPVMQPGTLRATKAIGWFIEEYGIAQVSMNITDIATTPLHVAFDEVCRKADARGVRVTGTEIVGLVPKRALVEAGKYFLRKQRRSTGIAEQEIVRIAVFVAVFLLILGRDGASAHLVGIGDVHHAHALGGTSQLANALDGSANHDAFLRDNHELIAFLDDLHGRKLALLRRHGNGKHALAAAVVQRIVGNGGALAIAFLGDYEQLSARAGDFHAKHAHASGNRHATHAHVIAAHLANLRFVPGNRFACTRDHHHALALLHTAHRDEVIVFLQVDGNKAIAATAIV